MAFIRETLVDFLENEMALDTSAIEDDTPLISTSVLDSFNMLEMITFIEKKAGIKIGAMEVNLDNLDSIAKILTFVARKQG